MELSKELMLTPNNLDKDLEAGDLQISHKFQLQFLNSELDHYALLETLIEIKLLDIAMLQLKSLQDFYTISLFISIFHKLFTNIELQFGFYQITLKDYYNSKKLHHTLDSNNQFQVDGQQLIQQKLQLK